MEHALPVYRDMPPWQAFGLSLVLHALAALALVGAGLAWHSRPADAPSRPVTVMLVTPPGPAQAAVPSPAAPAPRHTARTERRLAPAVPEPVVATMALPRAAATVAPAPAAAPTADSVADTSPATSTPVATIAAPVAGDAFFAATANAAYLHNPKPEYPHLARQRGLEGTVLLKVLVSSTGEPVAVTVLTSSHSGLLDDAAVAAVSAWRFAPAHRGKETLEDTVQVPIRFNLNDQG